MAKLIDSDGIDGPFDRAMRKAMREDKKRVVITADTITDADIEALFSSLPPGHYAVQWCLDARFTSPSHPHRQRNARRQCAELINARTSEPK
jgi:hypothetical protein